MESSSEKTSHKVMFILVVVILAFVLRIFRIFPGGRRSVMESERVIARIIILVFLVGFSYLMFAVYYAGLQLSPVNWNERIPQALDKEYLQDPVLASIHERMLKMDPSREDVTVVTAYFNLGKLNKGGGYTPALYKKWMSVFGRITNPLIMFTDSEEIVQIFTELRAHFPADKTKLVMMNRTKLWSFSLAPQIHSIFTQPGYPTFDPNTKNENYSCVMHAKFELVNRVIREEMYHTRYLTWLDIGLFRGVVHEKHLFPITVPPNFDERKVAYSGQKKFNPTFTPFEVVVRNTVWVGGAMFMGLPDILYLYTQDYMKAVEVLISQKIMSTDQQVIYIMYLPGFAAPPRVELQLYTSNSEDDWFFLGYIIKDIWDIQRRQAKATINFMYSIL